MIMYTEDPTILETRALCATSDRPAIVQRFEGLSRIVREFERLHLDVPSNLLTSIDTLNAFIKGH
jgi:hypothetical protein